MIASLAYFEKRISSMEFTVYFYLLFIFLFLIEYFYSNLITINIYIYIFYTSIIIYNFCVSIFSSEFLKCNFSILYFSYFFRLNKNSNSDFELSNLSVKLPINLFFISFYVNSISFKTNEFLLLVFLPFLEWKKIIFRILFYFINLFILLCNNFIFKLCL